MGYRLVVEVKEVRGFCPLYKPGDRIVVEDFYVKAGESSNICLHAFSALLSLVTLLAHGYSTLELGLSGEENLGYLQCPDPGPPHTKGGTVLFEIKRVKTS